MPKVEKKLRIKDGSISYNGHKTSLIVSFDGGAEERYEVDGNDPKKIYAELQKALDTRPGAMDQSSPSLITDTDIVPKAELEKLAE